MKQILFGYHSDWMPLIATRIDRTRFQPSFAPLDAADLDRFDAVVPLTLGHYDALARAGAGRPPPNAIVPTPGIVSLCHDKLAFARWMTERGFGGYIPATYAQAPPGPSIRKPRRAEWGVGCTMRDGTEPPEEPDEEIFYQAIVEGRDEYACHFIRDRGRLCYMLAVGYTMPGPRDVRRAGQTIAHIQPANAHPQLPLFGAILAALDYEGTCCFNYKLVNGSPVIFEINPRFGSSATFDINTYVECYLDALADRPAAGA